MDWGHFGKLTIGRAQHPLMAFVVVLSYSRPDLPALLPRGPNRELPAWARGGLLGLERETGWPGCCCTTTSRALCSSAGGGEAILFHPALLAFAAHYRFEPRPVAVARGNEKGRVERAIRTIRDQFWPTRH